MSPKKRQQNPALIRQILDHPGHFNFWQAARILERAARLSQEQSTCSPDSSSAVEPSPHQFAQWVRFTGSASMGFPSTDIDEILPELPSRSVKNAVCYRVSSRILSFLGATGVLPFHYTDFVLERLQLKDMALLDFLDIFHHRMMTLYYRAGIKFRIAPAYEYFPAPHSRDAYAQDVSERASSANCSSFPNAVVPNAVGHHVRFRNAGSCDHHSQTLFALAGLTLADRRGLSVCPESLLYYAGIFSQKVRSAVGLRKFLGHYFRVGVEIEEFVASWQPCPDEYRSQLTGLAIGAAGNSRLGGCSVLGHRLWSVQNKVRLVIGPLDGAQARFFAPGSTGLRQLDELARLYAGAEAVFEYVLRIASEYIPLKTPLQRQASLQLGWNIWLARRCHDHPHFDLPVSVNGIS